MLEVLPIQDKNVQEALCFKCGVKFDVDLMAYAAYVDGSTVGICQFNMNQNGGVIVDLANVQGIVDTQAHFVLGRATLNFIDLCGIHYATIKSDTIDHDLLKAIGFSKNSDGIYSVDLTSFFDHPCQHNK